MITLTQMVWGSLVVVGGGIIVGLLVRKHADKWEKEFGNRNRKD